MNIELVEKDEHNLVFIVEGISLEMANALRRIMVREIPTMAIDEVIILKNDSPLYDEIVAHRLGLIPLKTDLETYKLPRDCECGGYGCPLCQVSLTCEITNTSNHSVVIYSKDLKSNDPAIAPVDPYTPIVKIDKDDKIILEAYAILGVSSTHAKFQPVSNVFYRFYPSIELDNSKCSKCSDKCAAGRFCPKKLFDVSSGKAELIDKYWRTCTLCDACEANCPEEAIKINTKEDTYIFSVESDGCHSFEVLIKKTFEIFLSKIDEFMTKLEEIEIES